MKIYKGNTVIHDAPINCLSGPGGRIHAHMRATEPTGWFSRLVAAIFPPKRCKVIFTLEEVGRLESLARNCRKASQ
jgi:hypothetical protein